jgi:uncharacterized membrane protein
MVSIEGVDYAFARPSPAALKAAGKRFACRYGGPGSDSKQLHADELRALRAAGIDVVANAEGVANGFKGFSAGKNWATSAEAHFRGLGMPADRPIYFSVDWDAGSGDWDAIDNALRGAASVIGSNRVGVYGSYDVIEHCAAANTAKWFWQTYAWSGGRLSSKSHLYQYRNDQKIGGADCDFTRALKADYGQWGYQEDDDMTEDQFIAMLASQKFRDAYAAMVRANGPRQALTSAVLGTDGVLPAPDNADTNPEWAGVSFLTQIFNLSKMNRDRLGQLLAAAGAEAAEVPPTAQENAAAVVAALGQENLDALAVSLRTVLGDERAASLAGLLTP